MARNVALNLIANDKASRDIDRVAGHFDSLKKHVLGIGSAVAGVFAVSAVAGFAKGMISEAQEAARVTNITNAVIKSTGNAAKISASGIADLSQAISNKVGVDDEAIQSGANLLLTFKNVKNEVGAGNAIFSRATSAIVDMTAGMHNGAITQQGLKASTIQLGKALNDPVKGISALTRVGIQFTTQQKEQIAAFVKSGNTLAAQKIILKEVESQFKGTAAAATDPAKKAQVAWANFKEELGTVVLPILSNFVTALTARAIPALHRVVGVFQSLVNGVRGNVAPVVGQVVASFVRLAQTVTANLLPPLRTMASVVLPILGTAILGTLSAFGRFMGWLAGSSAPAGLLRSALLGVAAAIVTMKIVTMGISVVTKAWAIAQWALNVAMSANPISLIIIGLAALAGMVIYAYTHFKWFRTFVQAAWAGIRPVFAAIKAYVKVLMLVFQGYYATVRTVFNGIRRVISTVWSGGIRPTFSLLKTGVSAVRHSFDVAVSAIKKAWSSLKAATRAPVAFIVNTVYNSGIRKVWNMVAGLVHMGKLDPIKFASGGIYPGYTPGRDVALAAVSGGEAIMRPEWTRVVGSDYVHRANAAARTGGKSGVASFLKNGGPGYSLGGIIGGGLDWFKNAAKGLFAKGLKFSAEHVLNPLMASAKGALSGSRWAQLLYQVPVKAVNSFLSWLVKVVEPKLGGDALGVVKVAKSQIGQGDAGGRDNNNNKYNREFGYPIGTPWCANFASYCIKHAKAQKHYRGYPTAAAAGYNSMQHVSHAAARPGDLGTYGSPAYHINIIESNRGGSLMTIGGNQGPLVNRYVRGGQSAILRPTAKGGIINRHTAAVFRDRNFDRRDRSDPLVQLYAGLPPKAAAILANSFAGKKNIRAAIGRAVGGSVHAGRQYLVGEQGPEWFTPRQSGGVSANGAAPVTVNVTVQGHMLSTKRDVATAVTSALQDAQRRGARMPWQ